MLTSVLISIISCSLIMILVWFWAYKIKNAGIVDIFWAFCFSVIALLTYFLSTGFSERKLLVCGILFLWGLRLGTYLFIRIFTHLDVEEGRYAQLRIEWKPNPDFKFFVFFQMQALSVVYLCTPIFIIAANETNSISLLEYVGFALWIFSILGEAIADAQLMRFKSDPKNKGLVCKRGLWNYSRHPNYFFQFMIWVSVFLVSLSSPYGWIGIICPITIAYLIFKVTGIPMTEDQAIRSKGEAYKQYQRTTSAFVPWFKRFAKGAPAGKV